ncbi:MAG: DUF4280 domain-containing protein [Lachnospiraceae bacterium]|nr:DUF4280 domain-containing protein [Lachnospiraceae bacterium]
MDILSWLFKKEDSQESPKSPEQLVFGAELKCPCGFKHSFLMLQTGSIDIDNLPSACVRDSKAFVNIMPFGTCTLGLECEQMIELEDLWENHEPQNMMVGEDEAITMKSTLTCKKSGMWIEPVSSGQDKKAAERILKEAALTYEMKQKYPGLLEILEDPYGSLYLHEGMCEMAVQFLEDSLKRNGDMEMASLYGEYDMEGMLIRSALGHLLVTCDVSRLELFVEGLSTRGVINGMEDTPGWDARLLNEEMLEMVKREYPETAKRVETKSYYKWQEEHKKALSVLGQMATEIAYGFMFYECMIAEKPYLERIERQRAYNAVEEPANVNGEVGGDAGGNEADVTTSKPDQMHHYATNKNKTYTPQFEEIAKEYELDLNGDWNKDLLPHQGRHPNAYHDYVLDNMKLYDEIAQGNQDIFLKLYENLKINIQANPDMLYKDYWNH